MAQKTKQRFYLARYRRAPDVVPALSDLGDRLTIAGLVFQGMGETLVLLLPGCDPAVAPTYAQPDAEEWSEIIRQTDNAECWVLDPEQGKVLHRKARYALSGEVQQRVWARDGFYCRYCHAAMGQVLMTVDHFVPLEQGGANDTSNYLTACRRCNKLKGSRSPEEFCRTEGYNYDNLVAYLALFK
jgi:5-methylcytosine-specific restriction endonuclease McrA